jgi:putative adenylate-forming enzyme
MRLAYHRRRLADFIGAAKEARIGDERAHWPRERLRAYQQERLDGLVRHAIAESPFYRERFAGLVGSGPVELERLPVLEKAEMMERFDELVTDRRLRRDELLAWVERMDRDDLYLDEFRVMATSGSSGRKGLFVFDQPGWQTIVSFSIRQSRNLGMTPRLPRRRFAMVGGAAVTHMSRQSAASLGVGIHRTTGLPLTMPVDRMVAALNDFQPHFMNVYPSIGVRLADEQLAGRLRLSLTGLSTSSELCPPEVRDRLEEAFGTRPVDLYATTEGLWGFQCERRDGYHLAEDVTLFENVDADNRPVPPGEPGAKLLVTNLSNRVQPVIRLELPDVLTVDSEPCPCGSSLAHVRSIEGRTDDVLSLPGRAGGDVAVLPIEFGVVARDRDVREFQVVQEGDRLRLRLVAREGAGAEANDRIREAVGRRLAELGVADPRVTVEATDELPRSAGGKLQIVVADRPSLVA